jgi:hypothetical protein
VNQLRASNNASANSLTVFSGLPEERYQLRFAQKMTAGVGAGTNDARTGIGWNSTSAASGRLGYGAISTGNTNGANMLQAVDAQHHSQRERPPPPCGPVLGWQLWCRGRGSKGERDAPSFLFSASMMSPRFAASCAMVI